ncbi:MAG: NAD(P)H-dependent oxidoreductase [Chloroflexota bacterium]|nr:MAG: NADPH-dependent FMN reductase [Chloroflexota bacterium]
MARDIHVLGFSGSLRKGSYNTRLLHIAKDMLPQGMTLEIFDLSPIPLYNEDVRQQGYPPAVAEFRRKIREADALLIACPEYNYSVTGVLKNAIDWASRVELHEPPGSPSPLYGKPLGIIGVGSRYGTVRAQLELHQIAVAVNMFPLNKPEVYISNLPTSAFDEQGNLINEDSRKFLRQHLEALYDWTLRLYPQPQPATVETQEARQPATAGRG